jgi:hypothetical protein
MVKKFPAIMEPQVSLQSSQKSTIESYPEPTESNNQYSHPITSKIHFNIIMYAWEYRMKFFIDIFRPKFCMNFSHLLVCYMFCPASYYCTLYRIIMKLYPLNCWLLDSSVSIATRLRVDDRSSIPGRGREFFSSPPRPGRLWGPPSLVSNGYRNLTLPLMPRLKLRGTIPALPSTSLWPST